MDWFNQKKMNLGFELKPFKDTSAQPASTDCSLPHGVFYLKKYSLVLVPPSVYVRIFVFFPLTTVVCFAFVTC